MRSVNRNIIFGAMVLTFVVGIAHRLSMGAVAEALTNELGYSGATLGFLTSATFYVYALLQIPAGLMVDWFGVRNVCGYGLILTALGSIIFASTSNITIAIIGRVLVGVGNSGMMLSAFKVQADYFEARQFPALSGITSCFGNIGVLIAMTPLAALVGTIGWRESFYLISIVALALAVFVFMVVPKASKVQKMSFPEVLMGIKNVLKNPSTWPPFFILFTMMGVLTIFNGLWGIPYITHVYNVSNVAASKIVSLIPIGFVVCGIAIGRICALMKDDVRKVIICGCSLFTFIMLVLVVFGGKPPLALVPVLFFFMGVGGLTHILAFTKAKEATALAFAGVVSAVVNMGEFIGSSILGPLFGGILDKGVSIGVDGSKVYELSSYRNVFIVAFVLCLGAVLSGVLLKKNKVSV